MSDEASASCKSTLGCDATENMDIKMEMNDVMDDSLDGGAPSVGSEEMIGPTMSLGSTTAPVSALKEKKDKKREVTGYSLYLSDARKLVAANNPGSSFGDVSRIVAGQWRNLPQETKSAWEAKAVKRNSELSSKYASENLFLVKYENSMDIKMEMNDMMDNSLDGGASSVGSSEMMRSVTSVGSTPAPVSAKRANEYCRIFVTGYGLYLSDAREQVAANNPGSSFGDVSRIVGSEWRNLPQETKSAWEEKAAEINREMAPENATDNSFFVKCENSVDMKMEMNDIMENSSDGGAPSVGSGEMIGSAMSIESTTALASAIEEKKDKKKKVTGYSLYSSDARKLVAANNPGSSFGDVSRIVAGQWRNLPQETKSAWEAKAKMNSELSSKYASENLFLVKYENSVDMKMEINDMMDNSLDSGAPSVGSGEMIGSAMSLGSATAPVSAEMAWKDYKGFVTGYLLFSIDVRKEVAANNPGSSFGDVSRIVGFEWRNLPLGTKTAWQEKAAKMNEELAPKYAAEAEAEAKANGYASRIGPSNSVPETQMLWECCWDSCDFQFEDAVDCIDHCVGLDKYSSGHVLTYFAAHPQDTEWLCHWRNCSRIKKGALPFPNLRRLVSHVKEYHIKKSTGRIIPLHERSKNCVRSDTPKQVPVQTADGIRLLRNKKEIKIE